MKKIIILLSVIIIIAMSVVILFGCVEKTEYDDKEIVSIHYYTTESFMPWQDHKYYNFNDNTYSTKHIIAEGYEDPECNPAFFEREEYKVIATFDDEQAKTLFNKIKKHGIYNFEKNYHNSDIMDGSSWHLTITFSDETTYESSGYMKYPKSAKTIDNDFLNFAGYKLFDPWEY